MTKMIILASKSPRRREMMKDISSSFLTYSPDIDESLSLSLSSPLEIVKDIAKRKAEKSLISYPNDIIITADTIVVFKDEIIGKPKDEKDAYRILRELSGNEHEVITAYVIIKEGKMIERSVSSKVIFNDLSDELINSYIESKSPFDKAGGYGIQDNEKFPLVKSYEGSYDNIKGFPTKEIGEDLKQFIS